MKIISLLILLMLTLPLNLVVAGQKTDLACQELGTAVMNLVDKMQKNMRIGVDNLQGDKSSTILVEIF